VISLRQGTVGWIVVTAAVGEGSIWPRSVGAECGRQADGGTVVTVSNVASVGDAR
jgi:hypothetical protein